VAIGDTMVEFIEVQHDGQVSVMSLEVSGCVSISVHDPHMDSYAGAFMSAEQAREIAAHLLAAADEIDGE
jgi:hypothetical protein